MTRRLALAAAAALAFAAPALAQIAPQGWTVQKSGDQWIASSPDQGRGLRVKLVYKAVQPRNSALALWFPEAHRNAAAEFGELVSTTRVSAVNQQGTPPMLASSIVVKQPQGRAAVLGYGYDTTRGRQLALIVLPSTLSKRNPAYRAAFAAMEEFWRQHGVFEPASAAPAPAPAP